MTVLPFRLLTVSSCCCGCSLTTGCYLIGVYLLFFSTPSFFAGSVDYDGKEIVYHKNGFWEYVSMAKGFEIVLVGMSILCGVCNKSLMMMYFAIITFYALLIFEVVVDIALICKKFSSGKDKTTGCLLIVFLLISISITVYFISVIESYTYSELEPTDNIQEA